MSAQVSYSKCLACGEIVVKNPEELRMTVEDEKDKLRYSGSRRTPSVASVLLSHLTTD